MQCFDLSNGAVVLDCIRLPPTHYVTSVDDTNAGDYQGSFRCHNRSNAHSTGRNSIWGTLQYYFYTQLHKCSVVKRTQILWRQM